jgi:double zinc ribbon protein
MALEIVGALATAALVLWLVFEPLLASPRPGLMIPEPDAAEETRQGMALIALKEIEFDRETGKLSDQDYEMLKERYSAEALRALAAEDQPPAPPVAAGSCPKCGPRPESDALFCSSCGRPLGAASFCTGCGAALQPGALFCEGCGVGVAA